MRPNRLLPVVVCIFAVAHPPPSWADWDISAGRDTAWYHNVEHFPHGGIADQERGMLHGAQVRLDYNTSRASCSLKWSRLTGNIPYTGTTQIGFPITTTTALTLDDGSVDCELQFHPSTLDELKSGVQIGRRVTDRSIGPTFFSTPLGEVLKSTYVGFDVALKHKLTTHLGLYSELILNDGISDSLDVDFHGYADNTRLSTGGRIGGALAGGLSYTPVHWASLSLGATVHEQNYGASHSQPLLRSGAAAGSVLYPGSVQRWTSIELVGTFKM
jgi:hypothetical protein